MAIQTGRSDIVSRLADLEACAPLIVETAPDAFVGIDLESRIVDWNTQATTIFGRSRAEALAQTLWDTIIPTPFMMHIAKACCGFARPVRHLP